MKTIPSWEKVAGECGMHVAGQQMDQAQANELMQQFAALGYIEDPSRGQREGRGVGRDRSEIQRRAHPISGRTGPTRPSRCSKRSLGVDPGRIVFSRSWRLVITKAVIWRRRNVCLFAIADGAEPGTAGMTLLMGENQTRARRSRWCLASPARSRSHEFATAGNLYPDRRHLCRLLQWQNAKIAYEKAIALDEDNALAFQGLSTVYRRLGDNQQTVDCALRAVEPAAPPPGGAFQSRCRAGAFRRERARAVGVRNCAPFPTRDDKCPPLSRDDPQERGRQSRESRIPSKRSPSTDPQPWPALRTRDSNARSSSISLRFQNGKSDSRFCLKNAPIQSLRKRKSGKTFVLVSGLPRSGTSLMMQLLEAGGMPLITDGERGADVDNPRGYYEWEAIKQIGKNRSCSTTMRSKGARSNAFPCCCPRCRPNINTRSFS